MKKVESLREEIKPHSENYKPLRKKVKDLKAGMKAVLDAHIAHLVELNSAETEKRLSNELHKTLGEADKVLYQEDPFLDSLMAAINRSIKEDDDDILPLSDE